MYYVKWYKIMEVLLCFIRDMLIWLWKLKKKKREKKFKMLMIIEGK